jgi:AraC-like DNA-binding protein
MAFTPRELSELINIEFGVHFFDFVNGYRVDTAKVMLTDQPERTVLDVLYAVGFNSKSSFNTAFKKRTHMTPSAFRKSRDLARSMA